MSTDAPAHLIPMPRSEKGTIVALPDDIYWRKVEARLRAYSERSGDCLLWQGHLTHSGYGHISIRDVPMNAHRAAYLVWVGPIAEGLEIDHLCRVRHCIEPSHLEAVTHGENIRRIYARRTHCPSGHPYAEHGHTTPSGRRICRECERAKRLRYRNKAKEFSE